MITNKPTTLQNHTTLFGVVAVGLFSFGITAFIASSAIAPKNSDADTLVFTIGTGDYSASVSSADNINLNVESTPAGTVGIARDTITTTTNNPDGYKLYFSMDQAQDYDSSHPGNALYKDGNSSSSSFISPTTGTISAPSKLGQNTWGFALLGGANKQTGVPDIFSNFDTTYIDSNGNSSDGTSGNLVNSNNKFAAVPLRSNAAIVQESSSATPASGDQLAVYYGVNATTALTSGSYIGTVNYFLTADSSASLTDLMSLSPATLDSLGGQELTLATSLHTNYNFSTSDITVTLTDTNDSTNTASCTVTSVSTESGSVIAKCTTPALTVGTYDVTLAVATYGKTYVKQIEVEEQAPTFWNIQYMQDMTPTICSSVTTPANTAITADIDGSYHGDTNYVPQRTLYDYRGADGTGNKDNKVAPDSANARSYTIRKLADGNCWMTENLKLPLSAGVTVEAAYNNVSSPYSYTPSPACSGDGECALNANTNLPSSTNGEYYYNWYASSAETGKSTDINTDTLASICPVGWRLPANYTIDPDKSYGSLTDAYGFTVGGVNNSQDHVAAMESFPLSLSRLGWYTASGWLNYNGQIGFYQSSSTSPNGYAYSLYYSKTSGSNVTNNTMPQYTTGNYRGITVRCVAL